MEKSITSWNKQNLLDKVVTSIIVKRQKHFEEKLKQWRKEHEEEYKEVLAEIKEPEEVSSK